MHSSTANILVADDNRVNRLLLKRHLELLGHEVAVVENGIEALQRLREHPFDMLLLDIEMPELDGFAVLEHLLADPQLRELPVLVTSSLEGIENLVRCIELGAEDYLSKPVNPVLLKARIGASLEKKRLRDQQRELVSRFATSAVAQDLASSGFNLGGHTVHGTVLLCEIRSIAAMAESLGAEEIIELLNTCYALMFDAITLQGGSINQMTGERLMAIFGAPTALEQHGQRAVEAALEMVEMIEQFSAEQVATGKPALRIGIGIATGDMVAGYTGTSSRATYTCIGHTVNRAAQLENHTKQLDHTILIDGQTASQLQYGIAVHKLGTFSLIEGADAVEVLAVNHAVEKPKPVTNRATFKAAPQRIMPVARDMPDNAVFISYAHEDLDAVLRIKAGLEEAGLTTWSDVARLEVGDDYDRKIQKNIARCSYFIAVISATTQVRHEGYFRREWNYAIDRSRNMSDGALFILPVTIDETTAVEALVPDKFKTLHFTQLPGGEMTEEFRQRLCEFMSSGSVN